MMLLERGLSFEVFESKRELKYKVTCNYVVDGEEPLDVGRRAAHSIISIYSDCGISLVLSAELLSPARQIYEAAVRSNRYSSMEEALSGRNPYNVFEDYRRYGIVNMRDAALEEMNRLSFEAPYRLNLSQRIIVPVDRDHIFQCEFLYDDIFNKIVQFLRSMFPQSTHPWFKPEEW